MSDLHPVLPANATKLETSIALTGATRRPLPTSLPRDFWNPQTCPEHLLGWLALQFSVDVWNHEWPLAQKRNVVARSIELHQKKGTEFAVTEYLGLAGFPVEKVVTPPQGFFPSEDLTEAAYARWLESLPEIRLYRLSGIGNPQNYVSPIEAGDDTVGLPMFVGGGGDHVCWALADPLSVTHASRREAVLIEAGTTTLLGIDGDNSQDVENFYIPRVNAAVFYVGGHVDHGFALRVERHPDYLVSVRREGALQWWNLVQHGRQPVSATPQTVAVEVPDAAGFFVRNRYLGHMFATSGQNDRYLYESWRLAASGRLPRTPATASFLNYSRLGITPKTAEVTIDTRRAGPSGALFLETFNGSFALEPDNDRLLADAYRAVNASRAVRDRILIDPVAEPAPTITTAATLNDLVL